MSDPLVLDLPVKVRFRIKCGSRWEWIVSMTDQATGAPYAFLTDTAGTWHGSMDIRADNGALIAHLDDIHTPDGTAAHAGTIVFDDDGHVTAHLTSAFTTGLTPTRTYQNASTGWQNRSIVYAELELTDPLDGEPTCTHSGTGIIEQEVTTS